MLPSGNVFVYFYRTRTYPFFPSLFMRTARSLSFLMAGAMLLGPVTTFAASAAVKTEPAADPVAEEELLDIIQESIAPMPAMMDRGGGGYGIIAPGYGNGVSVDASITKEVTPDYLAVNAYCDSGKSASREEARTKLAEIYNAIKNGVGADGRVRRMGSFSIYPYYDEMGKDSGSFSSNVSIFVRITKPAATMRISDLIENQGCSVNWDVRLVDTQAFELDNVDDLITRLNKRKTVFEKLLGKKLTQVVGASLSTWVDSYGSYDPEVNKVDATTTLSVTFDLGGSTVLPAPRNSTRSATPKG